jgi:hypothetical protein
VTAVKDARDNGVQLSTDLTQPPGQATARKVKLTLPNRVVSSNFGLVSHGILCANPSSGTCKTIGTATATSPLYPTPLRGNVYLTGKVTSAGLAGAPGLSIMFPAPFALTLTGKVDIGAGSTTFENVPDIPQSDLNVTLTGGANAAFVASCAPASGSASSTLTSQNGDKTAVAPARFTVSGCPAPKPGKVGRPKIASASLSGLARGAPTLRFRLLAGARAPKLRSFAVALPRGLRFAGRRTALAGVRVGSTKPRSLALARGRLVVTLRGTAAGATVTIGPRALRESAALQKTAERHRLGSLRLAVSIKDAGGTSTTATFAIKHPR